MSQRDDFTEDRDDDFNRRRPRRSGSGENYPEDRPGRQRDEDDRDPPKSGGGKIVLLVVGSVLLALLVLGGVVAALLLPAVQRVRDAAARAQSQNNLKQIALAMHSFNDSYGFAPPAVGQIPGPNPTSDTFFFHILPFVEQDNVFRTRSMNTIIKAYQAPHDPTANGPVTSYATNHAALGTRPRPLGQHAKGLSNLIFAAERYGVIGGQPHNWSDTNRLATWLSGPGSLVEFGVQPETATKDAAQAFSTSCSVLMGDGSVRAITKSNANVFGWAIDPNQMGNAPAEW